MARVLLIDDDPALLDLLALAFDDAGHDVLTAADGDAGLAAIRAHRPDAVVSDVNLPRLDGFTLCKRLRDAGDDVPIVLLTSRDSEVDEALGLELGADDYVQKPFSTRVLLARVAALLRRRALPPAPAAAPDPRGLSLDADRLEARWNGALLVTTVTEFRLLEALTSRKGVVFTRERLLSMVRGDDSVVATRIVDTYVKRLRQRISALDPTFDHLETVIGAGYRWRGP